MKWIEIEAAIYGLMMAVVCYFYVRAALGYENAGSSPWAFSGSRRADTADCWIMAFWAGIQAIICAAVVYKVLQRL